MLCFVIILDSNAGTPNWAAIRVQLVFEVHPKRKVETVMAMQKHRCAGCGSRVTKGKGSVCLEYLHQIYMYTVHEVQGFSSFIPFYLQYTNVFVL